MVFYVNEDFPTSTAIIHKGECRYCNYGQGLGTGLGKGTSQWHGPLETKDEALTFALDNTKCREVRECKICDP